jgi:hypothetical protein
MQSPVLKKFAFLFFFGFSLSASAQYLGGSGDGDIKTGISSKLLNGTAGTAAWFYGGSGDGDIKAGATNKLLDGTTAVLAWYHGGSGDGDIKSGTSSKTLGGTAATTNWFYGGSGDGDVKSARLTSSYLGEIEWVGSTSTDWNTTSNWRQTTLPVDGRVKISTSAVRDLHLDQNRTINTLDFNGAGRKVLTGNFNLTVNTGFVGANSTNYVKTTGTGTVKTSITNAASFTFPVGNANYNPVTVVNNNSASDVFSVKVRDEVLVNGTSGGQVADPHVNATWDISKTNANTGSGVDFIFQWASSQERNSIANFSLNHHNGTDWDFAANTSNSVTGSTTKIMNHYGYTGTFSPFAIGYQNTTLPINLLYFTAECKSQGGTVLSWATATEINSDYLELQSSDDMLHWTILKTIPALGFHTSTYHYPEVLDPEPSQTTRYYRLKQVDFDGNQEYFQAVAAHCPGSATAISLYPNPATEQLHIQGAQAGEPWEIIDMTGRRIRNGTINKRPLQIISILGLPAGLYHLKLSTTSLPFIIQ